MQYDPLKDGWGANTDGRHLIVSDGSANISFLDQSTLQLVRSVAVNDNGKPVPMLNEVRDANHSILTDVQTNSRSALCKALHLSRL